jgi:hypothetical protein
LAGSLERNAALAIGLRRSWNVLGTLTASNGKSAGKNDLITAVSVAIMIMIPVITPVTAINPPAPLARLESNSNGGQRRDRTAVGLFRAP